MSKKCELTKLGWKKIFDQMFTDRDHSGMDDYGNIEYFYRYVGEEDLEKFMDMILDDIKVRLIRIVEDTLKIEGLNKKSILRDTLIAEINKLKI